MGLGYVCSVMQEPLSVNDNKARTMFLALFLALYYEFNIGFNIKLIWI